MYKCEVENSGATDEYLKEYNAISSQSRAVDDLA